MVGVTGSSDPTATARARLEEVRLALRAELGEEIEAPGQMTYGSQAAAASHVFAQQRDLALRDQAERRYHAVDHALARLSAGTYTICETCGAGIPPERQELLPWATTCVSCGSHAR
jgi:DnaK suppressor protein